METRPAPSAPARRGSSPRPAHDDWKPSAGLIDRMLAYRDWWNIPEGRGRSGAGRNRIRPQERSR